MIGLFIYLPNPDMVCLSQNPSINYQFMVLKWLVHVVNANVTEL